MMDAGSSGTRVYVYNWPCRSTANSPADINISQDALNTRVTPGLSTFGSNIAGIGPYFKPLIDFAMKNIPAAQVPQVPLFLRATAGMRLLSQTQQDAILTETRRVFRNTTFLFSNDARLFLSCFFFFNI